MPLFRRLANNTHLLAKNALRVRLTFGHLRFNCSCTTLANETIAGVNF